MSAIRVVRGLASGILITAAASLLTAQEPAMSCEAHAAHQSREGADHHAKVDERGDRVMGFDHARTTHHFLLSAAGGSIEVTANEASDAESRDAIRGHLKHIAKMFAQGDFEAPMLVHDRVPPGVPAMKRLKAKIRWTYEELPQGARVVASTMDTGAIEAIHEFLRFQIADHRTGDPGEVPSPERRGGI